jgi:ethanolamine utilization protein
VNYDNIVNLIVEEIYKKLNNNEVANKPKAVLLWEDNKAKFNILNNEFDILNFDKNIKSCEILIVSKLCMRGLCNLALGNSTSDEERFILKMLMKGKKVYILDEGIEYKRYKETAPKALYNKYLSYEDELKTFGIEVIKDLNCITTKKNSFIQHEEVKKDDCKTEIFKIDDEFSLDLRNKKLISESDLRKPQMNGVKSIIVSKRSIITPLATDFIRIHHLKLKRI